MLEQLVPEYLAQNMKEIGFDEPCWGVWLDGRFEPRYKSINSKYKPNQKLDKRDQKYCTAPTWDQVFSWFLERGLDSAVIPTRFIGYEDIGYWSYAINSITPTRDYRFETPEKAKIELIKKLYEKYKNKN